MHQKRKILSELFFTFMKIGTFTFGAGYAMLALIDSECIEKKKWITEDELSEVLIIAESTPGPIALNCATYTGYRCAGLAGATVATVGLILPSLLIFILIGEFLDAVLSVNLIARAFRGIQVAVALLIIITAIRMIRKMFAKKKFVSSAVILAGAMIIMTLSAFTPWKVSTITLMIISAVVGLGIRYLKPRKGEQI